MSFPCQPGKSGYAPHIGMCFEYISKPIECYAATRSGVITYTAAESGKSFGFADIVDEFAAKLRAVKESMNDRPDHPLIVRIRSVEAVSGNSGTFDYPETASEAIVPIIWPE
jgi:hypothetical protein